MDFQVALSDEATTDLEKVVAFLARKSQAAAERIGLELVEQIFSLVNFPDRGVPVKKRAGLRKLAHRHYLIIYRVDESAWRVEIVRIWDNRRNPEQLRV